MVGRAELQDSGAASDAFPRMSGASALELQRLRSARPGVAVRAVALCLRTAANSDDGRHCGQARLLASRAPIA